MTPERWQEVERLYHATLERGEDERAAFLSAACAGDEDLRREVESLLEHESEAEHFIDSPAIEATAKLMAREDVATLTPGQTINQYEIISALGAGGMGEVYLARDTRLQRRVALKFPTAMLTSDDSARHRLLREARSSAALDHSAICRVFELGEADGRHFIAMELIPGETLSSVISRGPLPLARALEWGAVLASALDEAHRNGIVHRDLKPGNVMVTETGQVKVMDFGLARPLPGRGEGIGELETWTAGVTLPGTIIGTPAYMAPELLKGSQADEKSDLWALGCILFEMLTGGRPFLGSTATELIAAILEREPDLARLPPETPAEVRLLLGRALRKDPAKRMRDAGDLRLALEEARESLRDARPVRERETPSAAGPEKAAGAAKSEGFSRRHLVLGTGAVGLLAAGFGTGALLQASRQTIDFPSYQRLTFRRGMIRNARFAPDQQTVLYGALWDGDVCRTWIVRPESPESSALDLPPATPLSISPSGELALLLGDHLRGLWPRGTLARVPLAGGAPRKLVEHVSFADWSPDGRELAVVRVGTEMESRTLGMTRRDRLEFPAGNVIFEPNAPALSFPRVSPGGDEVAVFEHRSGFGGSVVIVDRKGKVRYRSPEFLELFGLAWRGEEVWFTGANERRTARAIHAIASSEEPRLVMRMPGNVTLHDIATDGRLLIAHTSDRSETAVLTPGESTERNLSWLDASMTVGLSRDGQMALLSEFGQGGGPNNSVYIRGTDGSPAVRLGEGRAMALSPDGLWAAVAPSTSAPYLDLLPTGAGGPRRIAVPGMTLRSVQWLPVGEQIVALMSKEGRGAGLYLLSLEGGEPRALTSAGKVMSGWAIAPDGGAVAVTHADEEAQIYPIPTGEPRGVAGLSKRDVVLAWIERGLLVSDSDNADIIFLVDPVTGRRERWRETVPSDAAGIMNTGNLVVTPDGRSYAYWWHRALSDLYLVSGVS